MIAGVLIFDKLKQDTHSGGSGCACCGTVFSGYFFKQLREKKIKKMLLIATGALMNSTTSQQGESIPGISHAIRIELKNITFILQYVFTYLNYYTYFGFYTYVISTM